MHFVLTYRNAFLLFIEFPQPAKLRSCDLSQNIHDLKEKGLLSSNPALAFHHQLSIIGDS